MPTTPGMGSTTFVAIEPAASTSPKSLSALRSTALVV